MNHSSSIKLVSILLGLLSTSALLQAKRPNVVFILTDDQRSDALSCMGHPHLKTPRIDKLAEEGALFKNHFCTTSLCSPAGHLSSAGSMPILMEWSIISLIIQKIFQPFPGSYSLKDTPLHTLESGTWERMMTASAQVLTTS